MNSILIFFQICVIIWVAHQWKNQKRTERYADQCHRILKHWHNIEHYWHILTGQAVYRVDEYAHSKKFIEEHEDSILCFLAFLRNPEIYINKEDNKSMNMISGINKTYFCINAIFKECFNKTRPESTPSELLEHIINSLYTNNCPQEQNIKEKIEDIKESNEIEGLKKEKVYKVYIEKYNEDIKNLKDILLNYAHYKTKN